jgi:HD-GYP domain-containing protein (c-di-GMP phosphodiesterase class II)
MIENIHRWLLTRLVLVWFALSVVSGGLVHFFGNARLDDHVMNMAKEETAIYRAGLIEYLQSPTDETRALFKQNMDLAIEKDNFLVIRIYDIHLKAIAEAMKSSAKENEKRLFPKNRTRLPKEEDTAKKLALDGDTFLHMYLPLRDSQGAEIGFLEGIYHAPQEILIQMKSQSLWALAFVMLAVFLTSLAMYPLIIRLNSKLTHYSHILALTNVGMLKVLGSAIAKRDSDTNIHNYRVTLYSVRLGEKLGLDNDAMQGLIKGAFLHDVGKIAISDTILLKPGKLTDEEFEIMKTHINHGEDIIAGYAWLQDAADVVRYHHEMFDGSGYQANIAGEDIPRNARIFAVADVFDALTSRRPYKEPLGLKASVKIIQKLQGTHFDPAIVEVFLERAEEFYQEIYDKDEPILHRKLEACISTYFKERRTEKQPNQKEKDFSYA